MLIHRPTDPQNTASSDETVSEKICFVGALNMLLLLVVMFFAEVSSLQADVLFDFQMKMAIKGNAEAQFKVGEMYETGFGVKTDMKEAASWINKAANQGHATASYKLLYWDIKKNGMKGGNKAKYNNMVKKAKAGDGHAMYYIGIMYAEGVGVKKNYDKALDWLNKATFIGVLEAEREAVVVREKKQKALAQARRKQEKRKAAAAAESKRQDIARRKQAEKQAEENRKMKASAAANTAAAEEADAAADRQAEKNRQRSQQASSEKERKRQALLKQRAQQKKKRKEKFESDPCSGKSARFLSTCR